VVVTKKGGTKYLNAHDSTVEQRAFEKAIKAITRTARIGFLGDNPDTGLIAMRNAHLDRAGLLATD
jgi:hypothetical protein